MKRYYYAFDSTVAARHAFQQLRKRGVLEQNLSVVSAQSLSDNDLGVLIPRLGPGAIAGALTGFGLCSLVTFFLQLDSSAFAFMLVLFTATGATVSSWLTTPIDALPGAPRALQEEVNNGRALLVVDSNLRNQALLAKAFAPSVGAHLVWECVSHSGPPHSQTAGRSFGISVELSGGCRGA